MKDKEMIEEIKQIIDDRCEAELGQVHASSNGGKVTKTVDTKLIAKDIYEYLTKDSVVLSKEKYEKLTALRLIIKSRELSKKELTEKLKNEKYGIIGVDESSIEIISTRAEIEKETVEKIIYMIKDYYGNISIIDKIAKQFGVEIKE